MARKGHGSAAGDPTGPVARRVALARAGALAAGVGAFAVAAPAAARASQQKGQTTLNVRDFGAHGDGSTDDTGALQAAIDAVREHGGSVHLPPGVYVTRKLTLYSRVHLRGAGGDATTLKLADGANTAIIESDDFARFTGTRSIGGITLFSIRDLTLDGNKEHNKRGGYGVRLYGYGFELTEVIAFNCRNDGVFTEWGPGANLPLPSHQMEARLTAVRSHDNEGHGFSISGPHDSMYINCLAFHNGGAGFRLVGDSHGTSMVNCHAWGTEQNIAFDLGAYLIGCVNCYADLDGGIGVRFSRNDCRWIGGLVLGANHSGPSREIGVLFAPGEKTGEPAGCVVDTKIMNCSTAAVDFEGDRGLSTVRASLSQPRNTDERGQPIPGHGAGWIGKPHASTRVDITQGLGNVEKNLVVGPSFDLRAQVGPPNPDAQTVRLFARTVNGKTQLCAMFPTGAAQVVATEP